MFKALERFVETADDHSLREALLKKIAQMIYVVRSNIAHSEKTPQGPDRAKRERDKVVSEATSNVIADVFDLLFDRPSQLLAVYGTLTPEGPNALQLSGLEGEWYEGKVEGFIQKRDGFDEFYWKLPGENVPVNVLSSPQLKQQFDRLDRFEGPRYRRILVPVMIEGAEHVTNIYQGKADSIR